MKIPSVVWKSSMRSFLNIAMTVPENFFQFEKLLVALAKAGVDFAVLGGLAVILNGYPGFT